MRAALSLLFATSLVCGEWVEVDVWTPLPPGRVRRVMLDSTECELLQVRPAAGLPEVVLVTPDWRYDNDTSERQFGFEPAVAEVKALGVGPGQEVWMQVWSGRYVVAAEFRSGRFGFLRNSGVGKAPWAGSEFLHAHEAFEIIARRFSRRGPILVFVVGEGLNVDGRSIYSDANWTHLEPYWPLVGDSGLAAFSIRTPRPREWPPPGKTRTRHTFSSRLFGYPEIQTSTKPGEALGQALAAARAGSVIRVRMPARRYRPLGRPPWLRVYGTNPIKVLWERAIVAGGDPTDAGRAMADMQKRLCRLVAPLIVEAADLVSECDGRSSPGARFLALKAAFPETQPASAMIEISARPRFAPTRCVSDAGAGRAGADGSRRDGMRGSAAAG